MKRMAWILPVLWTLAGCEIETAYRVEAENLPGDNYWRTAEREDYTVHLSTGEHPDVPGIVLIALAHEPATAPFDLDDYMTWSKEDRKSAFAEVFEQKYRDIEVRHSSSCPYVIEAYDHRERRSRPGGRGIFQSPGMTLDELTRDNSPRGVAVTAPMPQCRDLVDRDDKLTLRVGDDEFDLTIRAIVADTYVESWF